MKQYQPQEENAWIQPRPHGYRMACCDCGLVHEIDFRVHHGHVQFRVRRHNRATGQVRRGMKRRGDLVIEREDTALGKAMKRCLEEPSPMARLALEQKIRRKEPLTAAELAQGVNRYLKSPDMGEVLYALRRTPGSAVVAVMDSIRRRLDRALDRQTASELACRKGKALAGKGKI